VWATDVSEAAVTLARANAGRLGLDVDVRHGDLLDPLRPDLAGRIDLLVSNPPYVTEEEYEDLPSEVKAEPLEALVGGTNVHRRLVEQASRWLAPGGWLVVEIGAAQGPEVAALAEEALIDVAVLPDLVGRDRVVRGRRPMPSPSEALG
jgi:release factor glutamine methyltransferase